VNQSNPSNQTNEHEPGVESLPLHGVDVIEVAQGVAGPFCGRFLAALGANVVKVERPPLGDWSREIGPFLPGDVQAERSALYLYNNMGKKSVLVDWETESGVAELEALVSRADVFIEDWDRTYRDEHRLSTDRFTSQNSELIEICATPFGLNGPYSLWKSTPMVQLALGGYLYLTGDNAEEPLMLPGRQPDYLTGLNAHIAVQIALWERTRNGKGRFLEMSMLETLGTLHQFTFLMETYSGVIRTRNGREWNKQGPFASYGITTLPCDDGWVCFGISAEDQWERMCAMLGREDLLTDPEYETRQQRSEKSETLDRMVIDWMKGKTRQEVFRETSEVWLLPTAPLLNLHEVLEDPQLTRRNLFQPLNHPVVGDAQYPTFPFSMSESKPVVVRAPLLGEHTSEVLGGERE
jgi:crotonobetainyl-CoA:carnitine CoA-transferase CaiB-like acyl-CoA transferase